LAQVSRETVIVVCGEALIDVISSDDGVLQPTPGGGPFNTARALARLGVRTSFLGHLSTDEFGRTLADRLTDDGADLSLATFGSEPTTLALAKIDGDGLAAYQFFIDGTSAPNLTPAMLPAALTPEIQALHFGSLGLLLEPIATTLTGLASRECRRRLVMVDPNIRPALIGTDGLYRGRLDSIMEQSTIVKASDTDLAWLFPDLGPEEAARNILMRGARLVVVTLGEEGAIGIGSGVRVQVDAPRVEVVDTIGAGDAFGAAFLAWLDDHDALSVDLSLSPHELTSALGFACQVASLICARAGADPPWRAEINGSAEQ
jgi:fructokinase